ncbi:hypothetical protein CYR55_21555 [Chimaeribacter californicus]|uniref:General secretion pathway protein GspA n=1 Tax=Chimaeribacter californicus TaxID=2060067 RepID=A0A2N5DVD5_9GAMM|nr:peptidoglycan-binding protein [Chimaeribacter californicus]PLR30989.1 hypothetical protein CYR55_21555 [Chimaeribacter californicus]
MKLSVDESWFNYEFIFNTYNVAKDYLNNELLLSGIGMIIGDAGCGKTGLAKAILDDKQGAFLLFAARKESDELLMLDASQEARGKINLQPSFSLNLWDKILYETQKINTPVLLVLDNAHFIKQQLSTLVYLFVEFRKHTRHPLSLLIVGEKQLLKNKSLIDYRPNALHLPLYNERACLSVINTTIMEREGEEHAAAFTLPYIKYIQGAAKGNPEKITRIVNTARQIAWIERGTASSLCWRHIKLAVHDLGKTRRTRKTMFSLLIGYACFAMLLGWHCTGALSPYLPVPGWLMPEPVIDMIPAAPPVIDEQPATERQAMQQLFRSWGYDVAEESAWCDQIERAGLQCETSKAEYETLEQQGLPWIAQLHLADKLGYAVVIRMGKDDLDLLIGKQTWTVKKSWFQSAWKGGYTLFWKPAPSGKTSVTAASSSDDILWLNKMLSRALHLPLTQDVRWNALLVEKIKRFQQSKGLQPDGTPGKATLIQLWLDVEQSARLAPENETAERGEGQ